MQKHPRYRINSINSVKSIPLHYPVQIARSRVLLPYHFCANATAPLPALAKAEIRVASRRMIHHQGDSTCAIVSQDEVDPGLVWVPSPGALSPTDHERV